VDAVAAVRHTRATSSASGQVTPSVGSSKVIPSIGSSQVSSSQAQAAKRPHHLIEAEPEEQEEEEEQAEPEEEQQQLDVMIDTPLHVFSVPAVFSTK